MECLIHDHTTLNPYSIIEFDNDYVIDNGKLPELPPLMV